MKRHIERRSDGSIWVTFQHLEKIKPIYITKKRRQSTDEKLNPEELSRFRSLI